MGVVRNVVDLVRVLSMIVKTLWPHGLIFERVVLDNLIVGCTLLPHLLIDGPLVPNIVLFHRQRHGNLE